MDKDSRLIARMLAISLVGAGGCSGGAHGVPINAQDDRRPGASPANELFPDIKYSDKEVINIKIPTQSTSFHNGPSVVADKFGFFRAEGIKTQYVNVPPGSGPMLAALKKGDIDLYTGHPDSFLNALAGGVKVIAVVAGSKGHPLFPHDTAWVPKNSPIREPKDVIGKKVGGITTGGWTQGCMCFYWGQYFKQNHIDPSQVINAVVPPQQQEQAIQQGLIDIMSVHPPLTGVIERSGKYRRLWSSWEITNGDVIDKQDAEISLSGFTEDYVKTNPDVVRRYVRAFIKAEAFTVDNQELYVDWIQGKIGWDPIVHEGGDHNAVSTGLIRETGIEKWIAWKVWAGDLKPGQLKPSEVYTNEFNPYSVYKVNDPVTDPTYWDTLPPEALYLPIQK